jgi:hypothetical protein
VRQLYYRAEVESLPGIDKTEGSYAKIQRQVLLLRRDHRLPYRHISDLTRWMRKPQSFDSVEAALHDTARHYRKALWRDSDVVVEVWCEKDALSGVILPVTSRYDVPLMPCRGYSSETFCFEAVEMQVGDDRPYLVYYLGDFDRSGRDAANALREKLERFGYERNVDVELVELAITEQNVLENDQANGRVRARIGDMVRWLPTRPHKRNSRADQLWQHEFAVELDAIEPDDLRALVQSVIEQHMPPEQLKVLTVAEESEREMLAGLARMYTEDDDEDE